MKTNIKRIISLLLILLVVILSASMLFACNNDKKKRERDARERTSSVVAVKDAILSAIDEDWGASLDVSEIAVLDNAGDYIVTNGWADMVCEVLKKSSLQTGKLTALKNAAASEDGQKLLADFNDNAELIIPIMRNADFTSTDISNIFYDLLCALASDSGKVIENILKKITETINYNGVTLAARNNLNECSINLRLAQSIFVPTDEEKTNMLAAFAKAKAPMSELISFAYNMSIGSITDNIFEALFSEDGALGNITDSEINTIVSTLIRSVADLKQAFDDDAIKNLNAALTLVIDKFDTNVVTSPLYAQVVQYAKYAFSFVDIIPTVCDVISSTGKIFEDDALTGNLREAMSADLDSETKRVNFAIIISKVLLKIREDFTAQDINALIDKLTAQMSGEYQKAVPIMVLDVAFNISAVILNAEVKDFENAVGLKHADILGEDELSTIIGTLFLSMNFDKFKQTFADYKNNEVGLNALELITALCAFNLLGINNPYDIYNKATIDSWYNYYVYAVNEGDVSNRILNALPKVTQDIKAFVADFYNVSSDNYQIVESIAAMDLKKEIMSKEDVQAFDTELMKSDMLGIVALIMLAFKM